MIARFCFLVPILCLFSGQLFAEKIVIWNLRPQAGVSELETATISSILTGEIEAISKKKIISEAEMRAVVDSETMRISCGADDNVCIAEIGAALGAPFSVSGTLSRMGDYWIVSLQLIDIRKVEVQSRVTERFIGDPNTLVEAIAPIVCKLFKSNECGDTPEKTVVVKKEPVLSSPEKEKLIQKTEEVVVEEEEVVVEEEEVVVEEEEVVVEEEEVVVEEEEVVVEKEEVVVEEEEVVVEKEEVVVEEKRVETKVNPVEKREPAPKKPVNKKVVGGWSLVGGGIALGGLGVVSYFQMNSERKEYEKNGLNEYKYKAWHAVSLSGYIAGGVMLASGITLLIFNAVEQKRDDHQQNPLSFYVTPSKEGFFAGIYGRW
jgi:hypothetical protein